MTILLVWLHLLAAVTWIGGMLFLSLVLVPVFKREGLAGERRQLFVSLAVRFRGIVWTSILLLLVTGTLLLGGRGHSWWAAADWPFSLQLKLTLVGLLIALTAAHDFWLGPKVGQIVRAGPESHRPWEGFLLRFFPWIARLGLVIAIMILYLGLSVART